MLLAASAALAGRPAVAAPTALTALRQPPRARHALALRSPCAGLLRTSPRASGQGLSHAVAPLFAKSVPASPLLVSYWPLARTTPCDASASRGSLPHASGESSFSASAPRTLESTPQIRRDWGCSAGCRGDEEARWAAREHTTIVGFAAPGLPGCPRQLAA